MYQLVLPEIGRYGRYEAGTVGIFSDMKQEGRTYRIASRYGIFRPYRPVWYGIDNLDKECYGTHKILLLRLLGVGWSMNSAMGPAKRTQMRFHPWTNTHLCAQVLMKNENDFTIQLIFATIYGSHCTFLYYSQVTLYYFN